MSLLYFFVEYLYGPHNNRLYGLGVVVRDSASQCIWAMCVKLEVGNDHIEVQAIRLQSVVLCEFGASKSWSRVYSQKSDRWTKSVGPLICGLPRSLMIVAGLSLLSRIYVSLIRLTVFLEVVYEAKNYIDVIYWLEESLPCIMSLIDSDVPVT